MLMMKATAIIMLMCINGVRSAPCTTTQVEEGSTAVITQTVPRTSVTDGNIQWRCTKVVGSDLTVINCNINENPPCISSLLGENVYSGTMLTSGSNYRVTLTVHNVSRIRDQTTWKWASRSGHNNVIGQCDLDVYSFQSRPVCQHLGISSDGNTVSWTCTASNVYPQMTCRFEKQKGRGSWITQNVDTQKTTTDGKYPPRTVYHNYTCTMNLPVSQLGGEGTYQFKFTASVSKGLYTLKTITLILQGSNFAYPRVELVGCPNADDSTQGYISEKDITKTCQCRLKEAGNPPGVAQWLDAQGSLVGQDGSLSLVYNPDDPAPTYTCRGYSGLGSGPTITYKPKFASQVKVTSLTNGYPPSTRHVTLTSSPSVTVTTPLFATDTPTVTEYKANSKSTELTVSAGDTVTFVCNAEGNPRPSVSVRGQRWDGVVTLQDTPSGAYGKESNGTEEMSCMDTDVYTCMADNGVGGGMSKSVSVFVECVPELPFTSFIREFSPTNGTFLKIEIPIIGFPEPQSYSLEKVSDNYRRKRAVIAKDIGERTYFVIYVPDNPPKGVVVLMILGLTERDSGQYVLTIDNGIKDGLDYSFNVSILSEKNNPSDDDNNIVIGLVIGWVVAVVLIASLCLVLVKVKVRTSRLVKQRQFLQQQLQHQQGRLEVQQQWQEQHQQNQPQQSRQSPRQTQQPRQLPRDPTHYDEVELNEYSEVNILDTQEQDNMFQYAVPQDARERPDNYQPVVLHDTRERQNPMNGAWDVEAINATHMCLEPRDVVTEVNESHSEYEIPDRWP